MSDALPAVPPLPPVLIGASSKAYLGLAELTRSVQVDVILADVTADFPVIVAYEPSWAIGQAEPAPENFLATIEEVRAVNRASARTSSAN